MKKIIRMTESDLTRLVKRVIKEQEAAKTPDLEAIKKQIVGKKVGLTSVTGTFQSEGKDGKPNFQRGEVFTTFLIEGVSLDSSGRLIMKGKDLKTVNSRGVPQSLAFGQVNIDTLIFNGCNDPKSFTAKGIQRVGVSEASVYEVSKGSMYVGNPTLSDMLFKAFGCAADIDATPDFRP